MTYDVASTVTTVSPAKTGDAREAISIQRMACKAMQDSPIASCPDPLLPQGFAYGEGKAAKGPVVSGSRLMAIASSAPASRAAPPPSSRR